jgi:acetyl esterase/lipase
MARKGITTVIYNYTLFPDTNYAGMEYNTAQVVSWTYNNISRYRSDPEKIFVAGHSAGAQLAGIIALDDSQTQHLIGKNPVKGLLLIDPFGLDVFGGLSKGSKEGRALYTGVFTNDPVIWKMASPFYHLHKGMPPVLMLVGEKTYPGIREGADAFHKELLNYQPDAKLIVVPGKKHSWMIFMFLNPFQPAYRQVISFIQKANN